MASHVSENTPTQLDLLQIYNARLQSMVKNLEAVIEKNICQDSKQGVLSFMLTPDMKNYRVKREIQLLKDVILAEKEQVIIKLIEAGLSLKKENTLLSEKLKTLSTTQSQHKDSKARLPQQRSETQTKQEQGQMRTGVYERILQNKISQIKQIELEKTGLMEQLREKDKIISDLQASLGKIGQNVVQLQNSLQLEKQTKKELERTLQNQKISNAQGQSKIKELEWECQNIQESINELKTTKESQILCKTQQSKQYQKFKKQQQILQTVLKSKEKQIFELTEKLRELTQQQKQPLLKDSNSEVIKKLKQKVMLLEEKLMNVENNFSMIQDQVGTFLRIQIKKLKVFQTALKKGIQQSVKTMKSHLTDNVSAIVKEAVKNFSHESFREFIPSQNNIPKLKKLNLDIDHFLEQVS